MTIEAARERAFRAAVCPSLRRWPPSEPERSPESEPPLRERQPSADWGDAIDACRPALPQDQLAAILRERIERGQITSRLPSEATLRREFGLAPMTIRKAVWQLRDEGLVRTVPGWGTYIVEGD